MVPGFPGRDIPPAEWEITPLGRLYASIFPSNASLPTLGIRPQCPPTARFDSTSWPSEFDSSILSVALPGGEDQGEAPVVLHL